jgi:phosphoserine phosphatase RsbU/P
MLYTDGIVEAQNGAGEAFGLERLSGIAVGRRAEPPEGVVAAVLQEARDFCQCASFSDDVALVVLKPDEGAQDA